MRRFNQSSRKLFHGSLRFVAMFFIGLAGFNYPALSAVALPQTASKQVVASASGESIRLVSLGELIQMRLEVIGSTGEILFDSGFKSTNVIDWPASDNKSQRLVDGSYLCIVSVKDSTGKTARRQAIASLHDQTVSLKQSDSSLLTAAQVDAAGTVSTEDGGLTIVEASSSTATAVLAHDGDTAHLSSGAGGLAIGSGDFFANKALEHIRITAEGNVGIGTSNPQSKLDVVGLIRASEGIIFPDGSIQFSASKKTFGAPSQRSSQSLHAQGEDAANAPDTSGTGTTGKISKWQDGPNGVLNDSNITEVAGAIGINGSPDTSYRLDVNGSTRIRGSNPGFNLKGLAANGNIWLFQTVDDDGRFRLFGQDNVNPGLERLTISLSTGNVGIGATVPTAKLDVAGNINTSTQYNIGGSRVFAVGESFSRNVFAGRSAGAANGIGDSNSFFGHGAGAVNVAGASNSFFGRDAGNANTASNNSFFGAEAGFGNTSGTRNSSFGLSAGRNNQTGSDNAFFGYRAGLNSTASFNSFFGSGAGDSNTSGANNSFFGYNAGGANLTGANNAFFGYSAGLVSTGSFNSFFGSNAGNSTTTGANNALFGANAGQANQTGEGNSFFGYNAGNNTTVGGNSFFGGNAGALNTTGDGNAFFGYFAGNANTTGFQNSFFGYNAGLANQTGEGNSFFGYQAGNQSTGDSNSFFGSQAGKNAADSNENSFFGASAGVNCIRGGNTFIGNMAGFDNITGTANTAIGNNANVGSNLFHATAIGAGSLASISDSVFLGRPDGSDAVRIPGSVVINGTLVVGTLGSAGSTSICLNASDRISPCSSSLRYKTSVQSFKSGLEVVRRLRPITFNWKEGGVADVGFGAEEVNAIEPLLTTRNAKGEIEGVKYGQLTTVLVNAVKEQQRTIEQQQRQIDALKKLVCLSHPQADVCK